MEPASAAWAMFYANLVAMDSHPGNKDPRALAEMALTADQMLHQWRQRFDTTPAPLHPRDRICPSSPAQR